jgi:hypothetical protein
MSSTTKSVLVAIGLIVMAGFLALLPVLRAPNGHRALVESSAVSRGSYLAEVLGEI